MTPSDLEIHQRHFLKSKDKKQFVQDLIATHPKHKDEIKNIVNKKSKIEWIKLGSNEELYAIDNELAFWLKNDRFIPLISFLLKHELPFDSVVVDEGAIRFMARGADVMRPGIIKIDPGIEKDDIVLVKDPNHGKVLLIGKALYDAVEMEKMDSGRVISAVHSLSDDIWEFSKNF
mgnify:CR=1 FL=1